jgi:hypothetical protein
LHETSIRLRVCRMSWRSLYFSLIAYLNLWQNENKQIKFEVKGKFTHICLKILSDNILSRNSVKIRISLNILRNGTGSEKIQNLTNLSKIWEDLQIYEQILICVVNAWAIPWHSCYVWVFWIELSIIFFFLLKIAFLFQNFLNI